MLISSLILLALRKLKMFIQTKVLKTMVKCLDGPYFFEFENFNNKTLL